MSEKEIETIFHSLGSLHKSGSTNIRWHEFVAAGLSQTNFDDRILKRAFNRFDSKGKGYITVTDVNELLRASGEMDKGIIDMWRDGMEVSS